MCENILVLTLQGPGRMWLVVIVGHPVRFNPEVEEALCDVDFACRSPGVHFSLDVLPS